MDRPLQEKMNEVSETTIESADGEGKVLSFIMRCKISSSFEPLRVFVIKLLGVIGSLKVHLLIDLGSSHFFLSSKMAKNAYLKVQQNTKRPVELANGKRHYTNGCIPNLSFTLTETKHTRNVFVLDMGEREVILGMD